MAGTLNLKPGSKLQIALDAGVGKEPDFTMICTFSKALDESAFLISIPMKNGKALTLDENQKFLIRYNMAGSDEPMIIAAYADDLVKEGIRSYWKMRRVSEQRQFFKRADERLKVTLPVTYLEELWPANSDGIIEPEEGQTLDISAGGCALFANRNFEVGEVCEISFPNIGTTADGKGVKDVVSAVCWVREAPKGSPFRFLAGMQFRFANPVERNTVSKYVTVVKKKFKL